MTVPIERRRALRSAMLSWLYDRHDTSWSTGNVADFLSGQRGTYAGTAYSPDEVRTAMEYLEGERLVRVEWAWGGIPVVATITHGGVQLIEHGPAADASGQTINLVYVAGDVTGSPIQQGSPSASQTEGPEAHGG
ncbi:MAG: hypothetical protein ACR2JO_09515 [Mycobacteriales bacterium]